MVETRSALKRKAMEVLHSVPLEPATSHYLKTDEEMETEREFLRKYGGGFIRHPDYHRLLGGVTQLIREGAAEWAFGSDGLRSFYWELFTYARYWCSQYSISDIDVLSDNQIRRLISSVDGFCVQMDWAQLRPILPPTAADRFGEVLGELLIYLTVHQRLFENPFWYFDGKEAPDDPDEDPKFGSKLKHLFDEFYKTNPTYGVLWKMQTQRLANSNNRHYGPNPEYGQYNAKRHEAALGGFADDLLASEPFCWLLKELDTSELATKRRNDLIDIFRKAVRTMIKCETWINGQPVLRGIKELGGIFHDRSSLVGLHTYCWRPRMDFWKGRKILVVSRPGLVYVDSINGYSPDTSPRAKEIIGAEVLPMYILGDDDANQDKMVEDDTEVEEVDDKQDEDDEDYVQGRSN